jgi:hypothetical protein
VIANPGRQGYTADMLAGGGKVPWPQALPMVVGNGIDLVMHGGALRGTLAIIRKDDSGMLRAKWTCAGSALNGREFLIDEGAFSEPGPIGAEAILLAPYKLA